MSRTLKWVLGIVAVLVVVAVIAGGVWFVQNRAQMMASFRPTIQQQQPNLPNNQGGPNGQTLPFGPRGFGNNRNRPEYGFRGPMMGMGRGGRFGFTPFGMGFFFVRGFFRLLLPIALLAIVALVFYQLGRRAGPRVVAAAPVPPPAEPTDAAKQ